MRYTNLPDDYNSGWLVCPKHNEKYHMSDRVCESCVDEYVEKHSQRLKDGDDLGEHCVCITAVDGHVQVSNTFKEGWMIIDKRPAVGISFMPDKTLLGASYFQNREQAINNGYEVILEFNKPNQ
jgi:hypothetical protein